MAIPDRTPPQHIPHLLPPNSTDLEQAANVAVLRQSAKIPRNVARRLWNPYTCEVELLPWLAWAYGLQTWSNEWSEAVKRARVAEAIPIARTRGTVASIRKLFASYGGTFVLTEWWQKTPRGVPHTFEILMTLSGQDGDMASASFIQSVLDDIERTKPLRSHFTVSQGLNIKGGLKVACVARAVAYRRFTMQAQ